jgi:hypothetical protein
MQRPPATSFQIVRSQRAGRILMALSLAFAGVPLCGWHAGMSMAHVVILSILWSATSAWLVHYWQHMPQGRLRWDGDSWYWSGVAEPLKAVAIQYDFQTSVWLLLVPVTGRSFGVWMDADPRHMSHWRSMRRALVGVGPFHPESDNPLEVGRHALR